jgi:hypothetical protein
MQTGLIWGCLLYWWEGGRRPKAYLCLLNGKLSARVNTTLDKVCFFPLESGPNFMTTGMLKIDERLILMYLYQLMLRVCLSKSKIIRRLLP